MNNNNDKQIEKNNINNIESNNEIQNNQEIIENSKEDIKEEEFTINEFLENMNKELIVISKFEKDDQVKNCTYQKGYITQEIYVCLTCKKEKDYDSGICVACVYKCHENHEVFNLNFKRNFRCDCGNSKYCIFKFSYL